MPKSDGIYRGIGAETRPEISLAVAVIAQALADLKNPSDPYGGDKNKSRVQSNAISFFTAGGDWAVWRHFWFTTVGLDEVAVFEALEPWLQGHRLHRYRPPKPKPETKPAPIRQIDPIPRPDRQRKFLPVQPQVLETLAVVPEYDVFNAADIHAKRPELSDSTVRGHLTRLVETGHLRQMANGFYLKLELQQHAAE